MQRFKDARISEVVTRSCIVPCERTDGDHDDCYAIVKDDDDDTVVRMRDGAYYRLTFESLLDQEWVRAERMDRASRVRAGLAEPSPRRRLTPAQVTVATALRAAGIHSARALRGYAAANGISPEDALRRIGGRDVAERAMREFGR